MAKLPAWKQAEKDFEDFFKSFGKKAYVHRLTDTASAKATAGKNAFIVAQPSDYLVVIPGGTHFAEVKSSTEAVSFPHSNIQKKQIASSRRIVMAGGSYLFFIKNLLTGQWFIVPAQQIHHDHKTRKSTRWEDIAQYEWNPHELP